MKEAAQAVITYVFQTLQCKKIVACTHHDNQQQSSETELENPEANESNKFLVVYRWVGIVHEVEGDPHSLRSDCADSVSLRVATHFPPFQWPFPLRSGNTELLSHRKIQAFPAKISPS